MGTLRRRHCLPVGARRQLLRQQHVAAAINEQSIAVVKQRLAAVPPLTNTDATPFIDDELSTGSDCEQRSPTASSDDAPSPTDSGYDSPISSSSSNSSGGSLKWLREPWRQLLRLFSRSSTTMTTTPRPVVASPQRQAQNALQRRAQQNSKATTIVCGARDRRFICKIWRQIRDKHSLGVEILALLFKRQPQLLHLFAYGEGANVRTSMLAHDARFIRHAQALITFVDACVVALARNDNRGIVDQAQRLGRRHAAILAARCTTVRAEWWSAFASAIFDVLLPYTATRGAKALILYHLFVTRVCEQVALGFLHAHLEQSTSAPTLSSAMPTIYEHDSESAATSLQGSQLQLDTISHVTTTKDIASIDEEPALQINGATVRRSSRTNGARCRRPSPRVFERKPAPRDANNNVKPLHLDIDRHARTLWRLPTWLRALRPQRTSRSVDSSIERELPAPICADCARTSDPLPRKFLRMFTASKSSHAIGADSVDNTPTHAPATTRSVTLMNLEEWDQL